MNSDKQNSLWVGIITLFPEMFKALEHGIPQQASKQEKLVVECINPRDFTNNLHQSVDDRPYGGGPGMVMMVEPLKKALEFAKKRSPLPAKVIYLSPVGSRFDHSAAVAMAQQQALILIAGRYEGIDQRFINRYVDEQWSLGDFVTSGGELPAMVMIDSIIRHLPGVLGHAQSAQCDSFATGLLDHPHYTRPEVVDGEGIPPILKSGNHRAIAEWRLKQALGLSWEKRPDLLAKRTLSVDEQRLLNEYKLENQGANHDEHDK